MTGRSSGEKTSTSTPYSRCGCDDRGSRQVESHPTERRLGDLGQCIVLGGDDAIQGQARPDRESHQLIDDHADRYREDDRAIEIAVWLGNLRTATGDCRETFESENRKRGRGQKAACAAFATRRLECSGRTPCDPARNRMIALMPSCGSGSPRARSRKRNSKHRGRSWTEGHHEHRRSVGSQRPPGQDDPPL